MNQLNNAPSPTPSCPSEAASTQVLFDGSCPLCRREIALYKDLKADGEMQWVDISACTYAAPSGLSKETLMRRFHVVTPEGILLSGAAAFVFVWKQLPGWRWLARLASLPGMLTIMEWSYRGFLIIRPSVQKLVRLAEKKPR